MTTVTCRYVAAVTLLPFLCGRNVDEGGSGRQVSPLAVRRVFHAVTPATWQ